MKVFSALIGALVGYVGYSSAFMVRSDVGEKSTILKVSESAESPDRIDPLDPSIGVTAPLGLFDPLGWLDAEKDPATKFATFHANFERRRAVERKHGRIAMLAVVGMLFHNADIEFPGYLSKELGIRFSDIPNGITGLFHVPLAGLVQIIFAIGVVELAIWPASNYSGDYGTGYGRPFVPNYLEGDELKYKLDLELNQGRAAMMGIMGAIVGEVVTGQTLAEQIASGNLFGFGPTSQT